MKVGDLVRYMGARRIGIEPGAVGYVESVDNKAICCIFTVRMLSTWKIRRILKGDLDVVEN